MASDPKGSRELASSQNQVPGPRFGHAPLSKKSPSASGKKRPASDQAKQCKAKKDKVKQAREQNNPTKPKPSGSQKKQPARQRASKHASYQGRMSRQNNIHPYCNKASTSAMLPTKTKLTKAKKTKHHINPQPSVVVGKKQHLSFTLDL